MRKFLSLILSIMLVLTSFTGISVFAEDALNGEFIGATLNLGTTLTIDYYATLSEKNDNVQARFKSSSGRETVVDGVYDSKYNAYKFSYTNINPQCMNDVIDAELICNNVVLNKKEGYSVKAYCDSLIMKTESELSYNSQQLKAFRTLLADVLSYGRAAQEYTNYNTENLADTSPWVANFKSTFASAQGIKKVEGNTDATNKVISLGLNMANVNKIYFRLAITDDVVVKLNDKTVDLSTVNKGDDGTYVLYTNDIKATGFDDVYTLTIEKAGEVISKVQYNVHAYIMNKYNDASVGSIVKALYNYGASAQNYIKAMEAATDGGDFDLEVEDNLNNETNLIPEKSSGFETALSVSDSGWTRKVGTVSSSEIIADDYGNCLHFKKSTADGDGSYSSLLFDIMPYITHGGVYKISFKFKVLGSDETTKPFGGIIRTSTGNSFSTANGSNYFLGLGNAPIVKNNQWATYEAEICVSDNDIGKGGYWGVGLSSIQKTISDVYIDDFTVIEQFHNITYQPVDDAETWVSNEIVLVSDTWYDDPFNDVDVYILLTNGTTSYKVPGFWDGNNIWRVRFTCPEEGQWTYTTVCTDTKNKGLHNKTNTLTCTKYSGELDIYKHGFVTTDYNKKYFTYADGTPFFYLGDTHWALGGETLSMVETIVEKRVQQGYNVFQSQPIDAKFNLTDGVTRADLSGLRDYDDKFKVIADSGMVHVNSQFFFATNMDSCINNFGGYDETKPLTATVDGTEYTFYDLSDTAKAYLAKISRYWVARYSSYPVMWTLAQEVDNDCYWVETSTQGWCYVNNPYRYVAQYMAEYDPYNSPLSAHQEGADNTAVSNSAFDDMDEHTWWANQWKPKFDGLSSTLLDAAKEFWNSENKPTVLFEGRYVYLWTKDFGGRAQGWAAFLNGMYGHGYGAQDTWCYQNPYSENETTSYADGVDVITGSEKAEKTWQDALEFESSYQLGYMKSFFENNVVEWYNLIPRFDDSTYFSGNTNYYYLASNEDSSKIVTYFYNFSDSSLAQRPNSNYYSILNSGSAIRTGTYKNLQASTEYNYMWFNPRTGQVESEGTFTSSTTGTWTAPNKSTGDMVLYIYTAQ